MAERPVGVTFMGVISLVVGLLSTLKGLVWLGIGGVVAGATALANPMIGAMVGLVALVFGGVALLSGLVSFFVAWGIFSLRGWAWSLGMATHGFTIAWALLAALGPSTLRAQLGSLVLSGAVVLYLTRPGVKAAFGKA